MALKGFYVPLGPFSIAGWVGSSEIGEQIQLAVGERVLKRKEVRNSSGRGSKTHGISLSWVYEARKMESAGSRQELGAVN